MFVLFDPSSLGGDRLDPYLLALTATARRYVLLLLVSVPTNEVPLSQYTFYYRKSFASRLQTGSVEAKKEGKH